MNLRRTALFGLATLVLALPSWAAQTITYAETFDGTLDQATWRLGTYDQIDPDGGSPGAFLHDPQLDSAVPSPVYVGPLPSPFFGDYRAARVLSLGLDVNVFAAGIGVDPTRPVSLVLGSDMGTPDDTTDDCEVYVVGNKPLPRPGSGWRAYDFKVPADSTTLPRDWVERGFCAGLAPDPAWSAVITNVTRVSFPFADPDTFWYFQVWDLGVDTIRITTAAP